MKDLSPSSGTPKGGGAPRVPRCTACGKFLGYRDFDRALVSFDFTPDTHFTAEKMEYAHKACEAKTGPRSTFKMDFAP